MRSQLISITGIALATTILLPQQAFAQTNQASASAAVGAAEAPAETVTQILPISYSLTPATVAVSSAAQDATQQTEGIQQQQQPQQPDGVQQSHQAQQQRELANRKAWAKWHGMQRDAMRWELGYLALSAVDAAQTISCVQDHTCHEANPIYGRHPSPARVILTKLAGGVLHFWLVHGMIKKNPWEARLTAQLSAGIQGFIVAINFTGALKDN